MGRGRVIAYDVPVRCGEVLVDPGDLVFADFDGVVVIPKAVEAEVIGLAGDKASKETASRNELLEGRTLREVYERYGVL
jgi:regulator of RNase E activity RraA